jgi:hypothetical protein
LELIKESENKFKEMLGTKVSINKLGRGGRITIDFYTASDVHKIIDKISDRVSNNSNNTNSAMSADEIDALHIKEREQYVQENISSISKSTPLDIVNGESKDDKPVDDRSREEVKEEENQEIYSLKDFSI